MVVRTSDTENANKCVRERERERLGRVWVEGERDGKFVEGPNPMGLLLGNEGNVRYGVMHNA